MSPARPPAEVSLRELRLFLEETCCNLCRFWHVNEDGVAPERVSIKQESGLGAPGTFADLRIQLPDRPPYFIEVKYGYSPAQIVNSLGRKYNAGARLDRARKLIVVTDDKCAAAWPEILPKIRARIQPELELELWDEAALRQRIRQTFEIEVDSLESQQLLEIRIAMDRAIGRFAFEETWTDDLLQNSLIWHFGSWRLKQIRGAAGSARSIIPPGRYRNVAVLMADLCAFSSYLRDTREDDVVRHCLTTFYAKARYEILNSGGMMYQFVGDEVIGLFGIPDHPEGYLDAAASCARALVDIGNAVSMEWQRSIDRLQAKSGVHIAIAMGDMQLVSLRPFSRAHLSGIGESINMASRLLAEAGPSELYVTNTFYQALSPEAQAGYERCKPVEAKNMGTIQGWRASFAGCC